MSTETPIILTNVPPLARPARWSGGGRGLSWALIVCLAVGITGGVVWRDQWPAPGSVAGLTLGTLGLLCMVTAQMAYIYRKRSARFHVGRMSTWLEAHIALGMVGAFLVLLHSAGRCQGLAGATAAVMVVVIVSGLVGRFVYTAAPRTLDGVEIDARELLTRFAEAERRLQAWGLALSPLDLARLTLSAATPGWLTVFARPWLVWRQRRRTRHLVQRLTRGTPTAALELQRVLADRYALQLDIRSVAATRRWLSWWHVLHVPLAQVMFTLAALHVVAALRYLWW